MKRLASTATIAALCLMPAMAQDSEEGRGAGQGSASDILQASTDRFLAEDGGAIYATACAGCHQTQGQGAVGAAQYPTLSANPRLEGGRYPAWIVLHGNGAMPAFGDWLSDEQVLAVTSYIQQNLGNDHETNLTLDDIAGLRDATDP